VAYPLSFRVRYDYKPSDRDINVPVSLSAGPVTVKLFAKVDTGADHCLFERGFAEALQLEVEHGTPLNFSTVTGEFRAYGHEVTLAVLGVEVHALVYFFANAKFTRNVLGRNGWLNRVRLGLVDHDSVVYLSSYDE